jgi:hypothetical protein
MIPRAERLCQNITHEQLPVVLMGDYDQINVRGWISY